MGAQEVWTPEQLKAWAATRKDPVGDTSGKQPGRGHTQAGGNSCKDELSGLIFHVLKLTPQTELQFAKPRKFRFDFAFPEMKLAIEYEGMFSEKSGHTSIAGYSDNCQKYNLALKLGWRVLRYTALNYKEVLIDLPLLMNK